MSPSNMSSSMSLSIWGSRFSDEGGQDSVSYRSRKDEGETDVGDILAAARSELPYIPSHRLTHDKVLGFGTSYHVNREVYANPRVERYYVAVKYLKTTTLSDNERKKRYAAVLREVRVLTHPPLRAHGCIITALGYGWEKEAHEGARPYMVMNYSDHGSLPQYLKRCRIPFNERIEFGVDIAAALKSLHACGVIHGDVKPENVMVFDHEANLYSRPQAAKLADFGCSIFQQDLTRGETVFYLGTPKYNAPEIVGRPSPYVESYVQSFGSYALADCYSFGLFLWEVIKNGEDYIDSSLLQHDEDAAAYLARVSDMKEDCLLGLAIDYCDQIPDRRHDDFSVSSLKLSFSLALRDRRPCRATMDRIAQVLLEESRGERPILRYPLSTISPPSDTTIFTDEFDSMPPLAAQKQRGTTGRSAGLSKKQTLAFQETPFQHYQLDLLELAMEPPVPWDVQCDSVNSLKDAVRLDEDAKASHAHFQLAVAYRIGFGLEMSPSKIRYHLQSMKSRDRATELTIARITTNLEHEQGDDSSDQEITDGPGSAANFSDFFVDHHGKDYREVTDLLHHHIPDIMLNAQEHPFDVKPSLFHWLILVKPHEARAVLTRYKAKYSTWADSEKGVLNLSVSEPILLREFCLELFGTPLHWAIRTANIDLVRLLIDFGADVNACWRPTDFLADLERPRAASLSPLALAVTYHLENIIKILLDAGAEVSGDRSLVAHMIGDRTIPFSRAVLHAGNSRMAVRRTIAVLNSNHHDLNAKDESGHTALSRALENSNVERYIIEELMALHVRGDFFNWTPDKSVALIVARQCSERRFSSWKLSLTQSLLTDPDETDHDGRNALHISAQAGSHDMVKFLIDRGANVDALTKDTLQNTALALAAINGHSIVVELLLEAHAQLEIGNFMDETALEQAVSTSNMGTASLLIGAGARTSFRSDEEGVGSTILHAAVKFRPDRLSTVTTELIRAFPELSRRYVNVSDYQGWTPLHYSAYCGNLQETKALLELGASVDASWATALMDLLQGVIEDAENQEFAPEHAFIEKAGRKAVERFIGRLSGIKIELEQHLQV